MGDGVGKACVREANRPECDARILQVLGSSRLVGHAVRLAEELINAR